MPKTFEPYRKRTDAPFNVSFYNPQFKKMICRSLRVKDDLLARLICSDLRRICRIRPLPAPARLIEDGSLDPRAIELYLGRKLTKKERDARLLDDAMQEQLKGILGPWGQTSIDFEKEQESYLLALLADSYRYGTVAFEMASTREMRECLTEVLDKLAESYSLSRILIESGVEDERYQTAQEVWKKRRSSHADSGEQSSHGNKRSGSRRPPRSSARPAVR